MAIVSLRYRFRQSFRVPARAAFGWCTDFGPSDGRLLSTRTVRSVRRLTDDALVLTDTTRPRGRRLRIQRLVRIDPAHLAWTNTHLDGPYRHSQYWYRIVPDGPDRSHLEFDGLRLETSTRPASAKVRAREAERNRRLDARTWRERLAPALERDLATALGRPRKPGRRGRRAR
jgi:hypothetical protein